MKLITKTHQVNTVAARWQRQYPNDRDGIYEKLAALNHETATADDVTKIIGNSSWAGPSNCGECGATVNATVRLGDSAFTENALQVCQSCLTHALRLLKEQP